MDYADYLRKSAVAIASDRRSSRGWSILRGGTVIPVIAVMAVLAVGCSPSSESADGPDRSSAATSTATDDAAMRGAPEAGTCWNVPPEDFTPGHHFNDSPAVACTKPHTTETVFAVELMEPTVQAANELWRPCQLKANGYVGSAPDHWVPVSALVWLPSKQQVAAGASWARCDVAFPRDWADVIGIAFDGNWEQSVRTFSAKYAATEHADAVRPCLQREPKALNQWLVSCGEPHAYEATGQLAELEQLKSYPPPNQLRRAAIQCRDGLPAAQQAPAFGVTAVWTPPEAFSGGYISDLTGPCFVYRQDGTPLPPRT